MKDREYRAEISNEEQIHRGGIFHRRIKSSKGIGLRLVPLLWLLLTEDELVEQLHSLPEKELRLEGRRSGRLDVDRREDGSESENKGESIVETENRDRGSLQNDNGFGTMTSSVTSVGTSNGTPRAVCE